ncbi:MAG: hypothetical protein PWP48_1635, partial [Clostridiales bacterium]|nr:hypothetical protein [Clostridiales bacterium]
TKECEDKDPVRHDRVNEEDKKRWLSTRMK